MTTESVAAVLASTAAVGTGARYGGKWLLHLVRWTDRQDERWERMDERMMRVEAELFPNHGSSLRDAVDRIEQAIIPAQREGADA